MNINLKDEICNGCLHFEVCSYKPKYLAMLDVLKAAFNSAPEKDRSNMIFRDPECKFKNKDVSIK